MPRTIAALIRHGDYHQLNDTPSAWQPFALNDAGKGHASDAGKSLTATLLENQWHLHGVCHASQLLRAWQTASIICQQLTLELANITSLEVKSFDALAERSVGSVANLSNAKIKEIVQTDPRYPDLPEDWKSNSLFCLPFQGAESLMQSGERVAQHLNDSMRKLQKEVEQDSLQLFVGHGAAFRHAAHKLGVLEFEQIAKLSMFHGSPVYLELLDNGEWTHVSGDWKVRPAKTKYRD